MKKNVILLSFILLISSLVIVTLLLKKNNRESGFDIYIKNTTYQSYIVEIEISSEKVILYKSIINVRDKVTNHHPNFDFRNKKLNVNVKLMSTFNKEVIAELSENWPGQAGVSEETRVLLGLIIKEFNGIERISFGSVI